MRKKGQNLNPVRIEGRQLANTFWGKSWCKHLESFSDYANRLPRGRSYVRHGSVIHLEVGKRKINALVQGSSLYKVDIDINAVDNEKWQVILKKCSGEIASVVELLQGKLSSAVMETITDKQNGLFPLPKEITFKCSCYDWAGMCKHIAAVLYGIGSILDNKPELIFTLRNVDHMELLKKATINTGIKESAKSKVFETSDLSTLFGIDIDDAPIKSAIKTRTKAQKAKMKNISGKMAGSARKLLRNKRQRTRNST